MTKREFSYRNTKPSARELRAYRVIADHPCLQEPTLIGVVARLAHAWPNALWIAYCERGTLSKTFRTRNDAAVWLLVEALEVEGERVDTPHDPLCGLEGVLCPTCAKARDENE